MTFMKNIVVVCLQWNPKLAIPWICEDEVSNTRI